MDRHSTPLRTIFQLIVTVLASGLCASVIVYVAVALSPLQPNQTTLNVLMFATTTALLVLALLLRRRNGNR